MATDFGELIIGIQAIHENGLVEDLKTSGIVFHKLEAQQRRKL